MSPIPARESRPSIERIGRFIPRHFVGAGGFGKVWEVDDPLRPGSSLALKVLDARSDDADRPTPVTEIAREFQAGIRIRHPVLVEPIEVGVLESRGPYLLSEFVSGSPLVPFWSSDALEPVALQILEALHAIHQAGWRHGDIQPHNILVTQTDDKIDSAGGAGNIDVRLLDLGLARKINGKTGHVGDSPRYLAPEVLKGETPDHRADLYALGLVLFECLAGPVKKKIADHLLDTRLGKLHETVRNARLPGRLGKLITSLLDPDPRQRIQSARESIEVLSGSNAMTSLTPAFESVASLGQDSYFEVLETSLDWMTRGKSHFSLIAVEGATGLGKTRLCRETAAVAMSHGVRCITWRSLSSPEDFRRLGKTLPGLAKRHAPRAARIACLSALAKHHPDDDAREKARLLLIQVSMRFSRTSTTMTALAFVN
jgi:serine/threonine protein kinase